MAGTQCQDLIIAMFLCKFFLISVSQELVSVQLLKPGDNTVPEDCVPKAGFEKPYHVNLVFGKLHRV